MKKLIANIAKLTLTDKVLIFCAITFIAFFAYAFFRKSTNVNAIIKVGEESIRFEPYFVETGTRPWFAQLFFKGMKETDGLGRVNAEVLSIRSYDTLPSRKALYLTTKVRVVYNRASNQYTFKGLPLTVGSPIRLNLEKLYVEGLVTFVEGVEDKRTKSKLIVETQIREETPAFPDSSGTSEHIANALIKGDMVKDDQGNIIVKIIDKKVENAKRLVITSDGRSVIQTNPLRRDVYLTLEVNAIKIGDRYYIFDDVPLLVGEKIPINTSTISVWPEVTKINIEQ